MYHILPVATGRLIGRSWLVSYSSRSRENSLRAILQNDIPCCCCKMLLFYNPSSRGHAEREFEKFLYFLSFACALNIGTGYNLNTESRKLFNDPNRFESSRASYFGFSTALYAGIDRGFPDAAILVGAPRANVSAIPSVLEPGTVYKCGINDDECVEWNLDPTGNAGFFIGRDSKINQIKDNAWIGASVGVERNKTQPRVVVCAPRWKNNIINSKMPNWFMNGMCYWSIARNGETFEKQAENRLIPLLGNNWQITSLDNVRVYNYGMGQTGFSLHLYSDNNESEILLGNPGVLNWKGVPLLLRGSDRQVIPLIGHERLILSADYFGYSVSSGSYFQRGERWYAAGAPRGADITGRVLIFRFSVFADKRLNVKKVLDGQQHGEYFGASLASCDLNNDGKDEIVVGAPLWSRYMDEGRVYVYRVETNGEFVPRYLEGEVIGARFGSVVTCLGDLDYDGYGDIAVGAPYEDDHGAIYIYNGNSMGLRERYSQRIAGESISEGIRGFGGAISEPRDVDGNAYADIAVGAYLSGHVVLLRSQPVVTIRVSVTYLGAKQLQSNTTFFIVNVCSSYDGSHVPQKLNVERILKVDPLEGRAFYGRGKNVNGVYKLPDTLHRGSNTCDELMINLVKDIENVIEPIEIGVSLALVHSSDANRAPRKFCALCPVINEALSKIDDSIKLPFAVDCGPDNVCTSILDLAMSADLENGNRYTLGSKPTVRLAVRVVNRGEPAYNAQAHVFIPSPISLGSIPPECTENPRLGELLEVTCQLGNPLGNETTSILELDMSGVRGDSGHVVFLANVSTRSINVNTAMNTHNLTIYYDVDVDITIAGKSQQDLYSYPNKDQVQLSESIRFQHIYEVQKFGKSPIEESVVTVSVPTHWKENDESSIEIASVDQTFGVMEGRRFYCKFSNRVINEEIVNEAAISVGALTLENATDTQDNRTFERLSTAEDSRSNVPPDNRTLYLNCTNLAVKCTRISCKLGTFANSLTVAKLTITLDLQVRNLRPEATEARDIIYFVSNGSVCITQPKGIVQRIENKPDGTLVGTTFVGSPIANRVAIWIIVLSVLLGILLLALLTLGLVKLGFFHRKKREELEALKAESDKNHGFVLETSSSMEVLDKDSF